MRSAKKIPVYLKPESALWIMDALDEYADKREREFNGNIYSKNAKEYEEALNRAEALGNEFYAAHQEALKKAAQDGSPDSGKNK